MLNQQGIKESIFLKTYSGIKKMKTYLKTALIAIVAVAVVVRVPKVKEIVFNG